MKPILLFVIFVFLALPSHAQDWQLWRDKDQIQLYQQKTESGNIIVRVTTQVQSTLGAFILLLEDTDNVPNWTHSVYQVDIIDDMGAQGNIVHTHIKAPWPFSNRDSVTFSIFSQPQPCQLTLDITDRHSFIPEIKDHVRIRDIQAHWQLQQESNMLVSISYQVKVAVGGKIPKWIANRALLSSTFSTFQSLRKEIVKAKYNQDLPNILECNHVDTE